MENEGVPHEHPVKCTARGPVMGSNAVHGTYSTVPRRNWRSALPAARPDSVEIGSEIASFGEFACTAQLPQEIVRAMSAPVH